MVIAYITTGRYDKSIMVHKFKPTNAFIIQTVLFGYALLSSMLLLEAVGAVNSINQLLSNPHAIRERVVAMWSAMAIAAIVPPLVAYVAGNFLTKSKLKPVIHYFNGVLLALLAFWIWLFLTSFVAGWVHSPEGLKWPLQLIQFWPSLAAAVVAIAIALNYRYSKSNESLLTYGPYGVALVGTFLGVIISSPIVSIIDVSHSAKTFNEYIVAMQPTLVSTLSIIALFIIAFIMAKAHEKSLYARLVLSAIATSIYIIASGVAMQALSVLPLDLPLAVMFASLIGLAVWGIYLFFSRFGIKK